MTKSELLCVICQLNENVFKSIRKFLKRAFQSRVKLTNSELMNDNNGS